MEDQITVLTGITMRLEGQMAGMSAQFEGLSVEVRGMFRQLDRPERRVRKLEDNGA